MAAPVEIGSVRKVLRVTPRARALALVIAVTLIGAALSLVNVPLASSAANPVTVAHIEQALPTDPQSEVWNSAQEALIPLSSQQIYQPGGGSTRAVRVRALEDGISIGFRLSWDDDTRDDTSGNLPSDSAAIQLPTNPAALPYQCMGQSTNKVSIWQWKAQLEREGRDNLGATVMQSTGVRNLMSNGICKAVDTLSSLEPGIRSYHDGRQWHVVFYRALGPGNLTTAPLVVGTNTAVAFAVWNGSRGEARGMKSVSTWNTLEFSAPKDSGVGNLITLGVVILASAGVVAYTMRRMAS
jgi:DMSO reductase family type II enzyme heme b subunit